MAKPTFITEAQLTDIAESMCGSCYGLTHYFQYYKEDWGLTDEQMQELEDVWVPEYHTQNEIFLCDECGWWSYGGETQHDRDFGVACDECVEDDDEEDDEEDV